MKFMNAKSYSLKSMSGPLAATLWLLLGAFASFPVQGQPALISVVPARGATGVSPTAPVQFTFDLPMETSATTAMFLDQSNPFTPLHVNVSWNVQQTIMTCTPSPAFPTGKTIIWTVSGEDITGDPFDGDFGTFTTGGGGGSSGTGTNQFTSFGLGRFFNYVQNSTGPAGLDADLPVAFGATTTLSSNRTATQIVLTVPGQSSTNLQQTIFQPEFWSLFAPETNPALAEVRFPAGSYTFIVVAANSNQQVTLNLANSSAQPNAPHLSDYAGAQSIDPTQPYTLRWDAFLNGTAADYIKVQIGDNFETPDYGSAGALNGLARSVVVPAGVLTAGQSYDAAVDFFRVSQVISNASYRAMAYRISSTHFTVQAASGSSSSLVLTNLGRSGGTFSFDVVSKPGQAFTVEASTSLSTPLWAPVVSTNSASGRVRITDPASFALPTRFYRARAL